jgi:hypothetical protein
MAQTNPITGELGDEVGRPIDIVQLYPRELNIYGDGCTTSKWAGHCRAAPTS